MEMISPMEITPQRKSVSHEALKETRTFSTGSTLLACLEKGLYTAWTSEPSTRNTEFSAYIQVHFMVYALVSNNLGCLGYE